MIAVDNKSPNKCRRQRRQLKEGQGSVSVTPIRNTVLTSEWLASKSEAFPVSA